MKFLLFVFYVLVFAWLIPRMRFFRNSGLSTLQLRALFGIKLAAALAYGWVGLQYMKEGTLVDTWWLHYWSLDELKTLRADPGGFFTEIFRNNYGHNFGRFLSSRNSWWNDLHTTLFVKALALLNLITGAYYFVNLVFFAFLTTFASTALYRLFIKCYPAARRAVMLGSCLVPSYLFWTSGVIRDAPIALALAIVFLAFHSGLHRGWTPRHIAALFGGILLLLVFRNLLLMFVVPGLAAWAVAHRSRRHPVLVIGALYAGYAILFFSVRYLVPALDFPRIAVEKQEDFFGLLGNSMIRAPRLEPTALSFLQNTPHALAVTLLRPWPADIYNTYIAVACAETYLLLALFVFWLFNHKRRASRPDPFVVFCLFFCLSVFLFIGFTVTFLGAMVRYRGLVLPLLVTPMLATLVVKKRKNVIL